MGFSTSPLYPDSGTADALKINGTPVSGLKPANGQTLVYSSSIDEYVPQTPSGGGGGGGGGAPDAHAATHATGGTDPITPANIGAVAKTGDTMTGGLNISAGSLQVGNFSPDNDEAKTQISSGSIELLNGANISFGGIGIAAAQDSFRTAIRAIGGPAGTVDNAVPRANGAGGYTVQGSDIVIDDATTATQANVAITNQHTGQTNSALVLAPKGTGALILGPKPDGTAVGGNARGNYAVDLQVQRTAASEATTGANSVICGGSRNTVSTSFAFVGGGNLNIARTESYCAVVCGQQNTVEDQYAFLGGGRYNLSSGDYAALCGGLGQEIYGDYGSILGGSGGRVDRFAQQSHASGQFAATGDAQRARFVLRCKTTTNTAVELFLDGSATRLTIPSGKIFAFTINLSGVKSDGSAVAHYMRQYCLKNVSGTTSEVYAPVTVGSDNAAGTTIAISANDTNDALKVEVTGIAAETWRWVASVDAVEIAYGT